MGDTIIVDFKAKLVLDVKVPFQMLGYQWYLKFWFLRNVCGICQAEGDLHQIFDQSKSLVQNYYQQKIKMWVKCHLVGFIHADNDLDLNDRLLLFTNSHTRLQTSN